MFSVCYERLAIRRLVPGLKASALTPDVQAELFNEFMRIYIDKVQAPAMIEPRLEHTNKLLKSRNPDLYYGNLHMECYYFYR